MPHTRTRLRPAPPTGASPSGMIMHRSASHYTYTYPVYPAPILPTRYVDYTTSSPPSLSSPYPLVSPLANPPSDCFAPPSRCIHGRIRGRASEQRARVTPTYLPPTGIRARCNDAACKPGRECTYLVYVRRENIKDIARVARKPGKIGFPSSTRNGRERRASSRECNIGRFS